MGICRVSGLVGHNHSKEFVYENNSCHKEIYT